MSGQSSTNITDKMLQEICQERDIMNFLRGSIPGIPLMNNFSASHPNVSCPDANHSISGNNSYIESNPSNEYGMLIYSYITPFIILFGVIGNFISIRIFFTKNMRKLPASQYLVAISISDVCVLLTYVLLEWLNTGLLKWPGGHSLPLIEVNGMCQLYLYLSYVFRFSSVWLILMYTIERYIAVCHPFYKQVVCTKYVSRRMIIIIFIVACCISVYKIILSGSHTKSENTICSALPKHADLNFVLDIIYGLLITAVPFIILVVCNTLILRTLIKRIQKDNLFADQQFLEHKTSRERRISMEFTLIMLVISTTFVLLNIPYFAVWCKQFLLSAKSKKIRDLATFAYQLDNDGFYFENNDALLITKTLFFMNYGVNFLLYCITGRQYRAVLKSCCSSKNGSETPSQTETTRLYAFQTKKACSVTSLV